MDCQCDLREKDPNLFKDFPEGFCGRCESCGKFGHTRAHPQRPYTSAWCDECYQQLPSVIPMYLFWICLGGGLFLLLLLG